jgi:Peptidase family C25
MESPLLRTLGAPVTEPSDCHWLIKILLVMIALFPKFSAASTPSSSSDFEFGQALKPAELSVQISYVIVSPLALLGEFQRLADARNAEGLSTLVVAAEPIMALYPQGRDDAERLRLFLQEARLYWDTRMVLLGGAPATIATREVPNPLLDSFYDPPTITTDLYYSALDGDWDSNANGIFGEIPDRVGQGDVGIDLVGDVAVGRAPVRSPEEASLFVAKTLNYSDLVIRSEYDRALFLAGDLHPDPRIGDLAPWLEQVLDVGLLGLSSPIIDRLYRNSELYPGSQPLNLASATAAMASGQYGWVLSATGGDSTSMDVGDAALTAGIAASLSNEGRPFVLLVYGNENAASSGGSVGQALVMNGAGGAVAVIGSSGVSFLAPTIALTDSVIAGVHRRESIDLGTANLRSLSSYIQRNGSSPFHARTAMLWTLLGDPSLEVAVPSTLVTPTVPTTIALSRLDPVMPNPFNPSTVIPFVVGSIDGRSPTVRLSVYDVAGRRITVLVDEERFPGHYREVWNGRDRAGVAVSSGVYEAVLEVGPERRARKMALFR